MRDTKSDKLVIGEVTKGKPSHGVFSTVFLLKNMYMKEVSVIAYSSVRGNRLSFQCIFYSISRQTWLSDVRTFDKKKIYMLILVP